MRNVDHKEVLALRASRAQIVDTLGDREFRSAGQGLHVGVVRLRREIRIASIAHEAGYESAGAFSSAFKRVFGKPPSIWRGRSRRR